MSVRLICLQHVRRDTARRTRLSVTADPCDTYDIWHINYYIFLVSDIAIFVLKRDVKLQLTIIFSVFATVFLGIKMSVFFDCERNCNSLVAIAINYSFRRLAVKENKHLNNF